MNEINDQYILNYFYKTPDSTKINGQKTKNIPDNIQNYLNNRFDDSESNKETIMRIKYKIEKRPFCPVCNKSVRWYGHSAKKLFFNTCCHEHEVLMRKQNIKNAVKNKYNVENVFQLQTVKNKIKSTCLEKYGVDNPQKSDDIKKRTQDTCLKKYGHKNFGGGIIAKQKIQESLIQHFGSKEELFKHNDILSKQTRLLKYGDPNYTNIQKSRETCLKRYNVPCYLQSAERSKRNKEFQEKSAKTKHKNKTWVQSKAESIVYNTLRKIFDKGDILCQYRSELYPFNCDFYIKSLNLYIEYQGTWTHGTIPYNKDDEEHQKKVLYWLEKAATHKYYQSAIKTWTISDVNKRNIVQKNNLNYIEFWSIDEVKNWVNNYE